ncbi:MAG: hypothetical protein M0Z60_09860 [Nitrospiraceae bacterium]|nr:hypothetical protein [Nitrospiraceae bacterium]
MKKMKKGFVVLLAALALIVMSISSEAAILSTAVEVTGLPLSTSYDTPMAVAYIPSFARYYSGDGDGTSSPARVWDSTGTVIGTSTTGVDNRGVFFNPNTSLLESVSYSSCCSSGPVSGIQSLTLDGAGSYTGTNTQLLAAPIAGFGSNDQTMPSYDPATNRLYAKQSGTADVNVVDRTTGALITTITLDLAAAGVTASDVNVNFVGFTGVAGEELAIFDFTNRRALIFNLTGGYVGASALPAGLTVDWYDSNYGNGYANGLFFIFDTAVGANGTYRGFQVVQAAPAVAEPVPTMTEWGMIAFMVLAGLGSAYFLTRRRRIES